MITYTDVMNRWLQKMPQDRIACRNMADLTANILVLYSRDVLNFREHRASNSIVYTRTHGVIQILETVQPELTAILTILDTREDLPLCITARELRVAMQQAYQQIQETTHDVEAAVC